VPVYYKRTARNSPCLTRIFAQQRRRELLLPPIEFIREIALLSSQRRPEPLFPLLALLPIAYNFAVQPIGALIRVHARHFGVVFAEDPAEFALAL
jgi:hypothetical protein